jgi:hypothetical protein
MCGCFSVVGNVALSLVPKMLQVELPPDLVQTRVHVRCGNCKSILACDITDHLLEMAQVSILQIPSNGWPHLVLLQVTRYAQSLRNEMTFTNLNLPHQRG